MKGQRGDRHGIRGQKKAWGTKARTCLDCRLFIQAGGVFIIQQVCCPAADEARACWERLKTPAGVKGEKG